MFSSLGVRNYRIYWIGMFVSLIGTWIQQVAQSWLVFGLTNSSFLLGLNGFVSTIPLLLFSLAGGVLADRINKRVLLIYTQAAFMFLAFTLGGLIQAGSIRVSHIMIISFLNGIIMAFDAPARQAIVVELVGRNHLPNAIALNSVAFNSSRIIGPAVAGVLIAVIGMAGCFFANGISFLAVIAALLFISINHRSSAKAISPLEDLKQGLRFVKNHRTIAILIILVGVISLFGTSYVILMPVFAAGVLHTDVKGLGGLMSSAGFGALCGALLLARLGDFRGKIRYLFVSCMIFSITLMLFSVWRSYLASVVLLAIIGGSSVTAVALINIILQTTIADNFRGRVMSVFMITFAGMTPFGNLISGALSERIGVSLALLISGAFCFFFFIFIFSLRPQLEER